MSMFLSQTEKFSDKHLLKKSFLKQLPVIQYGLLIGNLSIQRREGIGDLFLLWK